MNRVFGDLPWMIGLLIIGMLLGSALGTGPVLWWAIIGLAVVAIGLGAAQTVVRTRRTKTTA